MNEPGAQDDGALTPEALRREIDRCHIEIAEIERQLRAGNPEVQGLCLALSDWSAELRILEALPWKTPLSDFLYPPSGSSRG